MTTDLAEKVCVVTGGGRGIGAAIASALAAEGGRLALLERDGKLGEATAGELRAEGADVRAYEVDVAVEADVVSAATAVAADFGKVDILVNNAAPEEKFLPIVERDDQHWDTTFAVNFTAPLLLTQVLGRGMATNGGGTIINISSITAQDPAPMLGAYVCSKTALEALTRLIALELGGNGVRANAIAPGIVETELTAALLSDGPTWQALKMAIPIGRAGRVEEVAELALFLASERSSFLSGQILALDGGTSAGQHSLLAGMQAQAAFNEGGGTA